MPDNYGQQFATTSPMTNGWIQGGINQSPEPSRILALDEAVKNITSSTAFVYEMAEEVRQLADNLFGAIPQPGANEASAKAMACGRVGGLQTSTQSLAQALGKLHAEIQRLRDL